MAGDLHCNSATQSPRVFILYGSQKGQAHAIAEEVFETARQEFSLEAEISCLSQPDMIDRLRIGGFAVFIVSTTGEGEPPDTMRKFWRSVKKKELSPDYFSNLKFALLGLGDSNYTNFCAMGKNLNQRLLSLGAEPFYPAGFADDGTGLEVVVDPWVDNIWQAFTAYTTKMHKPSVKQLNECTPLLHEILHESLSPSRAGVDSPSAANKLPRIPSQSNSPKQNSSLSDQDSTSNGSAQVQTQSDLKLVIDSNIQDDVSLDLINRKISSHLQLTSSEAILSTEYSAVYLFVNQPTRSNLMLTAAMLCCYRQSNKIKPADSSNKGNSFNVEIPLLPQNTISMRSDTVSNYTNASFTVSSPTHSEEKLTVPSDQPTYLDCEILNTTESCPEFRTHPIFPNDTISTCEIVSSRLLTDTERFSDVNRVIEMELLIHDPFGFQAGDAVGVLCPNDELEVSYLLERLDLQTASDSLLKLTIKSYTSKKGAIIPAYIPTKCSVRELFLHHLDIRAVPRKSFLWMLAQYTSNREEKYRLAKLSSKEGSVEYTALIRDQSATLMDILHSFPSCNPPLVRLIEFLQPLNPRYYSICNSPISSDNRIKIVFSVVRLDNRPWHTSERFGLCTSWLDRLATRFMNDIPKPKLQLSIIFRMFNGFHLPEDSGRPIIMVGPGTGVAPFIGFLEHREHLHRNQEKKLGLSLLFFGCRHQEGDFLFKDELDKFQKENVLSTLHLSFSRDQLSPSRYVQDSMMGCGELLVELMRKERAVFYLCGDAKNMGSAVRQAWILIFQKYGGMEKEEAALYVKELQKEKRYIQDIWL